LRNIEGFLPQQKLYFGRFSVRDVGVRVPIQVAADVHAEDALSAAD
jgi:hypothetical protein